MIGAAGFGFGPSSKSKNVYVVAIRATGEWVVVCDSLLVAHAFVAELVAHAYITEQDHHSEMHVVETKLLTRSDVELPRRSNRTKR